MIKEKLFKKIYQEYKEYYVLDENMSDEMLEYHIPLLKEFKNAYEQISQEEFLENPDTFLLQFFKKDEVYEYLVFIAQLYVEQNQVEIAKRYIKKALPYALIAQIYGLAVDCYWQIKDAEFSLYLFDEAIKKVKEQNNSSRLFMIKQELENLARKSKETLFIQKANNLHML